MDLSFYNLPLLDYTSSSSGASDRGPKQAEFSSLTCACLSCNTHVCKGFDTNCVSCPAQFSLM